MESIVSRLTTIVAATSNVERRRLAASLLLRAQLVARLGIEDRPAINTLSTRLRRMKLDDELSIIRDQLLAELDFKHASH